MGSFSFSRERGRNGITVCHESDKENAKDIAHRIPKYFRM
jgi:hypothetical protein